MELFNWNQWRTWFSQHWRYILIGVMSTLIFSLTVYYVNSEFSLRETRLNTYTVDRVQFPGSQSPVAADLEEPINDVLFPSPFRFFLLKEYFPRRERWGEAVREWSIKDTEVPIQDAPELRGPS